MKGFLRAWQDVDAATPVQGVLVLLALLALLIAASVRW